MIAPSRARRAPSAGSLVRRRLAVAVAKRVLPLAAVGLLATIALWPEFESAADRGRLAFKRVLQVQPEALRVIEPRYQGVDEQNRPFTLTAEIAVQAGDQNVVQLQGPRADLGADRWRLDLCRGAGGDLRPPRQQPRPRGPGHGAP
jgi:lipopolysaccharide export system protein LptC